MAQDALTINVPFPPSVNHYWRHSRGMHFISAEGKRFRTAVVAEVLNTFGRSKRIPLDGPLGLRIEIRAPDNRRRDLDNTLKALLDGLGHAGLYHDDSQIVQIDIRWGPKQPPLGSATVRVEQVPVSQMSLL